MAASAGRFPGYTPIERAALIAWASGALFLPAALAEAVMSTSRTSPMWTLMSRLTGRA
jgi:hypothetical protein